MRNENFHECESSSTFDCDKNFALLAHLTVEVAPLLTGGNCEERVELSRMINWKFPLFFMRSFTFIEQCPNKLIILIIFEFQTISNLRLPKNTLNKGILKFPSFSLTCFRFCCFFLFMLQNFPFNFFIRFKCFLTIWNDP